MWRFDQKIGKAFAESAEAGVAIQPVTPLRLETFLCALIRLFPDEMHSYFEDLDKLNSMCESSWPTSDQMRTHSQLMAAYSAPISNPGSAAGFHIQMDPDFERILSLVPSKRPTGFSIQDLMKSLSEDEKTI
ncbi:MAG TPA: hypothetical protein VLV88_11915, partial [Terriglobales bacterium]|nr:hypothetical protein [Terriglobales bacterium]